MKKTTKIVIASCLSLVTLVGTLIYVEKSTTTVREFYATIAAKSFVPAQSGTSVGVNPNGGTPIISSWHTPEKWVLLIRLDGRVTTNYVNKVFWVQVEKGDELIVGVATSYFGTGNPYAISLTDR